MKLVPLFKQLLDVRWVRLVIRGRSYQALVRRLHHDESVWDKGRDNRCAYGVESGSVRDLELMCA